ncbi:MAG: Glu-tRNA(Gln) amidotransferase subunit GatE [Methanobacteriaceae archaeon]
MDWDKLGLKMGLEIHQQLNSKSKLFCPCLTELVDKKGDNEFQRNLRPTQSELGQIDRAAFAEARRKMKFSYEYYVNETCLVETDDEPPHGLNKEALEISMTIGSLLNMNIADEVHCMRKQVIDGSNTGGFQRTALIATNGYLDTPYGRVAIENLCLEEDAARKVDNSSSSSSGSCSCSSSNNSKGANVHFRLDRLGIPLAEITTDPSIHHPEQVKEVAYQLGQVLRSTNVKRGLGTIRQDLNISIANGSRVEIKGVQNLDLMPEIVENEVKRQLALIEIKEELENRNLTVDSVGDKLFDLNDVFEDTNSKILANAESIKAIVLKGFGGLIGKEVQSGRRFGTEIASYTKKVGVSGIFHSDELPAYGISADEVNIVAKKLNCNINNDGTGDAFIIVAHNEDVTISALGECIRRAKMAFEGVLEETRKSLDNGNTEYMRPLPTANRMYLETDIPFIKIPREEVTKIASNLPELPDEKKARILKEYNLSEDLANQLVRRNQTDIFEEIIAIFNENNKPCDVVVLASLLAYSLQEIKREGLDISKLSQELVMDCLNLVANGEVSKDAPKAILTCILEEDANGNTVSPKDAAIKLKLISMSEGEVKSIISSIVAKNVEMVKDREMGAMGPLMGMSMKELKGRADGQLVNKILKNEILKLVNS